MRFYFLSINKFNSGCGWPAFDDEFHESVLKRRDQDGVRTEILCRNCNVHLGHIFIGEKMTERNSRYCVNSYAMQFISSGDEVIFSSGCFWGTQYWFDKCKGVLSTEVGYSGGNVENPDYEDVCSEKTGHVESIKVKFNNKKIYYSDLVKLFFETHNSEQENGQGPDIGNQYLSRIFYFNIAQKAIAEHFIGILKDRGMRIATKLFEYKNFYKEKLDYHDKYYEKLGEKPYCHLYRKLF